jgi:hypothetical protein
MEAQQWWALGLAIAAPASFLAAVFVLRRRHLIEDVPTSRCRGVFMGLNEVKGRAECPRPLTSDLSRTECVWFHFKVEEHYRKSGDDSGEGWKTVAEGGARVPFRIRDDTGTVQVDPEAASIDGVKVFDMTSHRGDMLYDEKAPARSVSGSTGKRRFTEHAIPIDTQLYILGPARLRDDAVEPVIAADFTTGPFIISMQSEEKLVGRLNIFLALFSLVWIAAAAGLPVALGYPDDIDPVLAGVAAAGAILALTITWLVLVFNGLVGLREREARAWSLIDVQLRRRHDLLPALVAAVRGYARHESDVQERLAGVRSGAEPPKVRGAPSDREVAESDEIATQQATGFREVFAIAESYPQLEAEPVFARLRADLVDTENRVAVAREFFNDSVTAMRDRAGAFPASVIAAVCRFRSGRLFAADGFERAVPEVELEPEPDGPDPVAGPPINP